MSVSQPRVYADRLARALDLIQRRIELRECEAEQLMVDLRAIRADLIRWADQFEDAAPKKDTGR